MSQQHSNSVSIIAHRGLILKYFEQTHLVGILMIFATLTHARMRENVWIWKMETSFASARKVSAEIIVN